MTDACEVTSSTQLFCKDTRGMCQICGKFGSPWSGHLREVRPPIVSQCSDICWDTTSCPTLPIFLSTGY